MLKIILFQNLGQRWKYSRTCLNRTPLGLKNLFSLDRFKLRRHLVDRTVKSVWFRQVYGLLRVQFRQVSLYYLYMYIVHISVKSPLGHMSTPFTFFHTGLFGCHCILPIVGFSLIVFMDMHSFSVMKKVCG